MSTQPILLGYSRLPSPPLRIPTYDPELLAIADIVNRKTAQAAAPLKEGKIAFGQNKWAEAIPLFTRAIEICEEGFQAAASRPEGIAFIYAQKSELDSSYAKRGKAQEHLGNFDEALADYNQAILTNSRSSQPYKYRAEFYIARGEYTKAIQDMNCALHLDDSNKVGIYSHRGVAHRNLGNKLRALSDFTHWIELDPNNAEAYFKRGQVHFEMERYRHALSDFAKAKELNPKKKAKSQEMETIAQEKINKGLAPEEPELPLLDEEKVEISFSDAAGATNNPHYPSMDRARNLFYEANHLYSQNQVSAALQLYRESVSIVEEILPQLPAESPAIPVMKDWARQTYRVIGGVHAKLKEHQKAIDNYLLGLQFDPANYQLHDLSAQIYFIMESFEQAIEHWTQALSHTSIDDQKAYCHFKRGLTWMRLGNCAKAMPDFLRNLALNPTHPFAHIVYFNNGQALMGLKRYDAALVYMSRAIALKPDQHIYYQQRAKVYLQLNKLDLAEADLKKAQELLNQKSLR